MKAKMLQRLEEIAEQNQADQQYVRYLYAHNFLAAYNEFVNGDQKATIRDETIYEIADTLRGIENITK